MSIKTMTRLWVRWVKPTSASPKPRCQTSPCKMKGSMTWGIESRSSRNLYRPNGRCFLWHFLLSFSVPQYFQNNATRLIETEDAFFINILIPIYSLYWVSCIAFFYISYFYLRAKVCFHSVSLWNKKLLRCFQSLRGWSGRSSETMSSSPWRNKHRQCCANGGYLWFPCRAFCKEG